MHTKDRPYYRKKYQWELAEELTGRSKQAISKLMRRKGIDLVEAIKFYFKKKLKYNKNQ